MIRKLLTIIVYKFQHNITQFQHFHVLHNLLGDILLMEERKDEEDDLNDMGADIENEGIKQDDGEVNEKLKENVIDELNVLNIALNKFAEGGGTEYH